VKDQREHGASSKAWQEARTELARERAKAARLADSKREGRLIEFAVVELAIAARNCVVRDAFLGLATRVE
jgi:phage terminase Nu1 subunit (DNA packaging protein)